jgi:hypothetical protein
LALTVLFTDVDYGKIGHKKKNKWQTREEAQAAIDAFPINPSIVVHNRRRLPDLLDTQRTIWN